MASYHTSSQPKAGQLGKTAKKTPKPKKVRAKYSELEIIKTLFEDRVGDETQRLCDEAGVGGRKKFHYAHQALKNVEAKLTKEERLSVARMKEKWDSGKALTEYEKRT